MRLLLISILTLFILSCSDSGNKYKGACEDYKCGEFQLCVDDFGTAKCECNSGYILEGEKCIIDENDLCKDVTCRENAHCDSSRASESELCVCDTGYHMENNNCVEDVIARVDIYIGATRQYKTVASAQSAIQDGFVIEIDAGTYSDVTYWSQDNITIRGNGKVIYDLTNKDISNRKGIWVIQGNNVTVENIEFTGAAVGDKNGAGIRYEGTGKLTIKNCYFHHNEDGILTGNNGTEDITVIGSEFHDHGKSNGGYSHNMYIGKGAKFTLINTYTHDAYDGHDVKSRADENYILYNRIVDHNDHTEDKASSYLLDLPEGGLSFVIGNEFHQSIKASNSAAFSYAKENRNGPIQKLYVINNTFVNSRNNASFLNIGGNPEVNIQNNIIHNFTTLINGTYTGIVDNNETDPAFVDKDAMNYELTSDSNGVDAGVTLESSDGMSLIPISEYLHPQALQDRVIKGNIDIGAHELK